MPDTLFLFDMDGVLIYPGGYKEALRATIDHFAGLMGQQPIGLTLDEIAEFEACGITNEWDSSMMCVGAMLVDALSHHPDQTRNSLEGTFETIRSSEIAIERPDFASLARQVAARTPHGQPPTSTIIQLVRERARGHFEAAFDGLLGDVYSLQTPTTRILQHFTLGSTRFRQTYDLEPEIEVESMLITRDRPLISQEMIQRLLERIERGRPGMAIYTARPSLPPTDTVWDRHQNAYSPEANLGVELLDLPDRAPLVASGSMVWLAARRGKTPDDYIKPSPVQALTAIGAARSGSVVDALEAAARLVEEDRLDGPLSMLADEPTRVVVFEDARGGIQAVRRAVDVLHRAGLPVTCEAVGVATEKPKRQALETIADRLVNDVNQGLEPYFERQANKRPIRAHNSG